MQITKENLESIGRRICRYNNVDPEMTLDDAGGMPAWMFEAMFVNRMMIANQATQDELKSLPMPEAPPEQPMVFSPYHKNETSNDN